MMTSFDPYHQWLGIQKEEQPPHHYRLLGLRLFEENPEVIDNAGNRVMMHLQSQAIGPNGLLAQRLLHEVSAAWLCLLSTEQRRLYDQTLAGRLPSQHGPRGAPPTTPVVPLANAWRLPPQQIAPPQVVAAPPALVPRPLKVPALQPLSNVSRPVRSTAANRPLLSPKKGSYEIVKVVVGGIAGLLIAQTILFYAVGVDVFGVMRRFHPARKPSESPDIAARESAPLAASDRRAPVQPPPSLPAVPARTTNPVASPTFPVPIPTFPVPPPATIPQPRPAPPEIKPLPPVPASSTPPVTRPEVPGELEGPPPPLAPAAILGGLPRFLDLPSPITIAPRKLVEFRAAAAPELSLHCANCAIPKEAAFVLEKLKARPEWSIHYCPNVEETNATLQEIARFYFREEGLMYHWAESAADAAIRQQLRNCCLTIEHGGKKQAVALRTPQQATTFVLDLSKPLEVQSLELANLPKDKAMTIRFGNLNRFSRGATWKNDVSTIALGKKAIVEFSQVSGARLEFTLVKKSKDSLAVTMRPIFLEQQQPIEMTLTQLAKMETAIPQSIVESQNSLQAYGNTYSSLSREFSSVQGSNPSSLADISAKNIHLSALESKLKSVNSRIAQLQKKIPMLKAKLAAIPQMKTFLEELHQKAALDFAVAAGDVNGGTTMLVTTSNELSKD